MQEIRLFDITKQEAYELDRRLAHCAAVALKEAAADNIESFGNEEELTSKGLEVLTDCYLKSMFVSKDKVHHQHVKERLAIELNRRIPADDPIRLELLIPVMAYALLVSNEYNEETVKKRIRADKERTPPNRKDEFPYNHWKHVDPYSIDRSENPPKSNTFARKLNALKFEIFASKKYTICSREDVSFVYVLLKNYRDVVICQDIARISLFLRSILIASFNDSRPMDTLIRMYLANSMKNSLLRSYALCDNNYRAVIENEEQDNHLITQYYNSFPHDENGYILEDNPIIFQSNSAVHIPLNLQFKEGYQEWTFSQIYNELTSSYTITAEDLNELLDFYLDATILKNRTTLVDDIKKLADNIIQYLKNQIEIPRSSLPYALTNLALWKLRKEKSLPTLHLNRERQHAYHGRPIDRILIVPQIFEKNRPTTQFNKRSFT